MMMIVVVIIIIILFWIWISPSPYCINCKRENADSSVTQITDYSQINILSSNELDVSGFHV